MQIKIIIQLGAILGLLTACASTDKVTANSVNTYGTNVAQRLYSYCINESCIPATELTLITADDLKPLEPEIKLPIIVKPHPKINRKYIRTHKKHKVKKASQSMKNTSNIIKKCFYINKNESGSLIIEGDKLVSNVSKSLTNNITESKPATSVSRSKSGM